MAASTLPRFLFLTVLASTVAVGCNPDKDDDGYKRDVDCDDEDADIYPGADELCGDMIDNNCDGEVDEATAVDAAPWYYDADGDGYGTGAAQFACEQPNLFVADAGDCDDEDPILNPDTMWYPDADDDGFGDESDGMGVQQCDQPTGYVLDNTDCDDMADDVNPDEEEICDDVDHDCDGSDGLDDEDGDGFAGCEDDCDDDNADINPDADEICDDVDNDCDDEIDENDAIDAPTWYLDYDADGYGGTSYTLVQCDVPGKGWVDNADDCDDLEAVTYPGADELCDEADNDCDDEVDETPAVDAPTYYIDADGDGYGTDDTVTTDVCELPDGYAEDSGDCDDTDPDTYPGASEYCDGHDDDCDGAVDENSAVDVLPWYEDADTDGYGNSAVVVFECYQPTGYSATSGDCDETSSLIYPGADEYCDGDDNDCDGVTDEDDALDADTWYADLDRDDFGDPGNSTTACSRPTGYRADNTDCDDSAADVNPDADEICNDGIDNDCDASSASCTVDVANGDAVFVGAGTGEDAGRFITTVGDINSDGIDDLLIPASLAEGGAGGAYLYHGSSDLWSLGQITLGDGSEAASIIGSDTSMRAAYVGAGGGDLDGDGVPDIAVGTAAPNNGRGVLQVFFDDLSGVVSTDDADVTIAGDSNYDYLCGTGGLAMGGDLDGNMVDDLLFAAFNDDVGGSNSGTVYIGYGPLVSGTDITTASVDDKVYGTTASDTFGRVAVGLGDLDGDGIDSFAAGTFKNNGNTGALWLFHTPVSGFVADVDADAVITGEDTGDYFGSSVAPLGGDHDGDGYDDILVGATHDDSGATDSGAVYILSGTSSSGAVDTMYNTKLYGQSTSGKFGTAVDATTDYYGDRTNVEAILVGASNQGASQEGKVYLFLNTGTGLIASSAAVGVLEGTDSTDNMGGWVELSGDIDGSGAAALLTGAPAADLVATDAGAAYIFFGLDE
jgi:hypothetical protein